MAQKTAVKSGKATATATWSDGKKAETGDDLVVPKGFTVEWNSLVAVRSLIVESEGGLSGASELNIGVTTAQAENIALKFATTATITWSGSLLFVGTFATTSQQIWTGGHSVASQVQFNAAGRWVLREAFKTASSIRVENGSKFESNGQEVTTTYFQGFGTGIVDITNSLVRCTGSGTGEGWHCESTVTLTTTGSTIELTDETSTTEKQFLGGAHSYNIITFRAWTKWESSSTFAQVNLFDKGMPATKGVRIVQGTTQTISALNFNGKAGELSRLESTEAGKPATVKFTDDAEPANSFAAIKDIIFSGGFEFAPNGKDEGGNTNLKLEVMPAVGNSTTTYVTGEGFSGGEIFAWKFVAKKTVTLESLELFTNEVSATASSLILGIYADSAGEPGALLAEGTHVGKPGSTQWVLATLGATTNIVKGTTYWLGILPIAGGLGANLGVSNGTDRRLAAAGNTKMNTGGWESEHTTNIGLRGYGKVITGATPTGTDTLALADLAVRLMQVGRTATDTAALADTATMIRSATRMAVDTTALADGSVASRAAARAAADTTALAGSAASSRATARASIDQLALSDSGVVSKRAAASSLLGMAEGASVRITTARAALDALGISDIGGRSQNVARPGADAAALADSGSRGSFTRPRSSTTQLGAAGTAMRTTTVSRSVLDAAALSGAGTRTRSTSRAGATSLTLSGATLRVVTKGRTGGDTLAVDSSTKLLSSAVGIAHIGIASAYYEIPPWRGEPGRIFGGEPGHINGASPGRVSITQPGHIVR